MPSSNERDICSNPSAGFFKAGTKTSSSIVWHNCFVSGKFPLHILNLWTDHPNCLSTYSSIHLNQILEKCWYLSWWWHQCIVCCLHKVTMWMHRQFLSICLSTCSICDDTEGISNKYDLWWGTAILIGVSSIFSSDYIAKQKSHFAQISQWILYK